MTSPIVSRLPTEADDVDSLAAHEDHGHGTTAWEAAMDEMLTMEEIEARYAPDWVLIAEPQTDDQLRVLRGKVVFHSPDRDEIYRQAMRLKLDRIAVRYLGEYPEHMVLGL